MSEVNPNAFIGRTAAPADDDLSAALGASRMLWDQAMEMLAGEFGLREWEWTSYSPKAGWSVRVRKAKRNIVYLTPCQGYFRVSYILGGKAVQAIRESDAPARVLKLIDAGTQYPEGLGIRWDVKSARDLAPMKVLAAAKLKG